MNPRRSPVAKYHRVEVALAERIRGGAYVDGTLPAERELAQEFGVARVTVRHALQRLEDQGLVTRHERRGTVATTGGPAASKRLLREHVDQFLDRGRADQRKVLRFGRVAASVPVARALGIAPGDQVLRVVRLHSRAGSALTYTESFILERLAHLLDRSRLSKRPLIAALEAGGVKIGGAQQSVRAERCPAPSPRRSASTSTRRCCTWSGSSSTRRARPCSGCWAGTGPTASRYGWRCRGRTIGRASGSTRFEAGVTDGIPGREVCCRHGDPHHLLLEQQDAPACAQSQS